MNYSNSVFKFMTVRNFSAGERKEARLEIQPQTETSGSLVAILESEKSQTEKIKAINDGLNAFVKTKTFFKTKQELATASRKILDTTLEAGDKTANDANAAVLRNFYETLYDNIVVRTATNANRNEVFKSLTDTIKVAHQKINAASVSIGDIPKLKILLPEGLIFSFSPSKTDTVANTNADPNQNAALFAKIQDITKQKESIVKSKEANRIETSAELKRILKLQNDSAKAARPVNEETTVTKEPSVAGAAMPAQEISTASLDRLLVTSDTLQKTEIDLSGQLAALNMEAFELVPQRMFTRIGGRWVNVTTPQPVVTRPPIIDDESIMVYAHGCYLKFPFRVADLRVVNLETVAYIPGEIAHINNTQPGESQKRITSRSKRIESFESLMTEDEVSKETDTTSTDKFEINKTASDVQSEETAINVNASVSGTYGVVTASLDAGFSNTQSSTSSNSTSQSYAKEIVQKVVDRVSHKVKTERSTKIVEDFKETVVHVMDNSKLADAKCLIYRWVEKYVKATLINYGKCLMFQLDVAHPASDYLSRAIRTATPLNIPPDPRTWKKNSTDPFIRDFYAKNPTFPFYFNIDSITEDNYLALATLYHAKLEQPPEKEIIVSYSKGGGDGYYAFGELLDIPPGYKCVRAKLRFTFRGIGYSHLKVLVGIDGNLFWSAAGEVHNTYHLALAGETLKLPISIWQAAAGYTINIEVTCVPLESAFKAWQIKSYQAIIEAYGNLKAEAESKMSDWNPDNPGLNPAQKIEIVRTEIKKAVLSKMFRCNSFWITDNYTVGSEYKADCCKDQLNAEKVRFLETVFDWKNMTYELYPYFYGDKDNWSELLKLSDDDPHFEAFLRSSFAKVTVPVCRDPQKEIAAVNFIINTSIANYAVVPAGIQHILDDLETNTPFGYVLDNNATPGFKEIKKEYDKNGVLTIYYVEAGTKVTVTETEEYDIEGNKTKFYYDSNNQVVISEIKEGVNAEGQKYNYFFNADNEKVICHKTQTEYDIEGNARPFYATDLGFFKLPTDLVILEAGMENGVEVRGYPENPAIPSDVMISRQYAPAIIKKE